MNAQRKAIYKKRHNALFGDRLGLDIANMFYDVSESIVFNFPNASQYEDFTLEMYRVLGIESPVTEEEFASTNRNELVNLVYDAVQEHYTLKNNRIAERTFPQVKAVFETPGNKYENIAFPLTDGKKEMQMVVSLEEAYKSLGKALPTAYERNITLSLIDNEWKEHLREMDDLRTSVQQAVYEQKDPLLIYKLESFELFKTMLSRLNLETVETLVKMDIPFLQDEIKSTNKQVTVQNSYEKAQLGASNVSATKAPQYQGADGYQEAIQNSIREPEKKQPVVADPKINRNDPCPCGSGRKYKQCHGK
jgi:preprotein translocase subunit SecA